MPVSIIYGSIIMFRNWLYDKKFIKSATFNFPIICIGNLAVGGTGKTPMTEYIVRLLKNNFKTATLSRGYKRKTEGFAIANETTTALEIGDEPMQFHHKFPDVTVAVGEERLVAIPQLLHDRPETEVIIMDDAFQHRQINAGLNIILTEYKNLYTRDFILPAGDLRDTKLSAKRADIIVITKCKPGLSAEEKNELIKEIDPSEKQAIFFTKITYGLPYHLFNKDIIEIKHDTDILLICGIANPKPLKEFLNVKVNTYDMLRYADHHIFDIDDLEEIQTHFKKISSLNKLILTTEKDAVRLEKFEIQLKDFPIYVLPIMHTFLFNEENIFNDRVINFVRSFQPNISS